MTEPRRDYRDTVFLPKTDFPMKAGLAQREPETFARWRAEKLYERVRAARKGAEKFILHDGPPYANGDMHIGHAMQRILKDMVVRTQTLAGKDAPFVPGWDCHGLPIEWKVEEQYRAQKRNKDEIDPALFRDECRKYAQHWVDTQREQIRRLGVTGDWDNPYLTMDFDAEAAIVAELLKFAESGQIYRGAKPVMWSPVEKTALAEAEVEYQDITSTQIDVAFEIVESPIPELVGAHAVVWTTTPWTIPVNQALAYGPEVEYRIYKRSAVAFGFDGDDQFKLNQTARSVVEFGANPDIAAYLDMMDAKMAAGMAATGLDRLPESILVAVPLFETLNARLAQRASTYDWSKDGLSRVEVDYIDNGEGRTFRGSDLAGTIARHPMHHLSGFFAKPRPFLPGDFVTTDSGTGLVHMAPDHGEDDFELCKAHGIEPVFAVEGDGRYRADWLWLGGEGSVIAPKLNAPDGPICTDLRAAGALLAARADYKHSYPHSWRSKAKVVFRCTPQWFIPIDVAANRGLPGASPSREVGSQSEPWPSPLEGEGGERSETGGGATAMPSPPSLRSGPSPSGGEGTLRQKALAAIKDTRWLPAKGENRIRSMVEGRPDWVISRQRAWGVPITLFVDRKTGAYLNDPDVNARIVAAVREKGVDAWTEAAAAGFLGPDRNPDDYERVTDILDVWFDSGCTHAFVLESGKWPDLQWPADLYLEGSDQHRGWFQSSLLESCGTRGRAPYNQVLTHGMTLDAKGFKQSKSLGNTTDPGKLMQDYGADIVRLWVASIDFTEDHRIGDEILRGVADQYRRLRNTFRYLLGALDGFSEAERVAPAEMPELERWALHRLSEIDAELKRAVGDYDFNAYSSTLVAFANNDLSAFLFDIRKDSLYCDAPGSPKRRAYRSLLAILFDALTKWLAPVLVFTAEEAWAAAGNGDSVHLELWPAIDPAWRDDALAAKWSRLRDIRRVVTGAIEIERGAKRVGSSLAAVPTLYGVDAAELAGVDMAELVITSEFRLGGTAPADAFTLSDVPGVAAVIAASKEEKCARCWRHLPEVTEDLCGRCEEVVGVA
jgi:isoleucyl-tRNA synthetase